MMESRREIFNQNYGGQGSGSVIGPTLPDEDYKPTAPNATEPEEPSRRNVFNPAVPDKKPGGTMVVEDDKLAVVGWLIGIDGDCKGKDFHLYYGDNVIGRGYSMPGRVCLNDTRIHGEGELVLFYDPVNNEFSIRPKEGGNCLCYLNDKKSIQVPQVLAAYDCITLRERSIENEVISKLMFIPLCGERFTWKTGISERND